MRRAIARPLATTLATTIAVAAITVLAASPANAAKGGGGGKPSSEASSGTVAVRNIDATDSVINWGDTVTFDVATTATDTPAVHLTCYQAGELVLTSSAGFYPSWPWSNDFRLASGAWTSGAADCTARLYQTSSNGLRTYTLATQSFHVSA